jgi:hypothetical protein
MTDVPQPGLDSSLLTILTTEHFVLQTDRSSSPQRYCPPSSCSAGLAARTADVALPWAVSLGVALALTALAGHVGYQHREFARGVG